MTYRIWIWIDKSGAPHTGAGSRGWERNAIDREQVYGSQLNHRCVAKDKNRRLTIVTPTDAKYYGYKIVYKRPFGR